MCIRDSMGMVQGLSKLGISFERAQVGDRYVLEKLLEKNWQVGGEASGHILCLDKHNTGDGIISALQVFASLSFLRQDIISVQKDWRPYPQVIKNVRLSVKSKNKDQWRELSKKAVAAVEKELSGGNGRLVIRASGTEPVVRVMVEAKRLEQAENLATMIADAIT